MTRGDAGDLVGLRQFDGVKHLSVVAGSSARCAPDARRHRRPDVVCREVLPPNGALAAPPSKVLTVGSPSAFDWPATEAHHSSLHVVGNAASKFPVRK